MTQLTGILGQLGQMLSAVPLVALLHAPGWTTAFLAAAALSVFVAILVAARRPRRAGRRRSRRARRRRWRRSAPTCARAWRHPGTRLGLWTHFTTQFSGTVFALLWGFPFLVSGEGLSPRARPARC